MKGCCIEVISIPLISFPIPYEDCKRAKALQRDSPSFKRQREVGNNRRSTRLPRPLPVIISCCSETRPAHSYTLSHNQPAAAPVIQAPANPAAGKLYQNVWCLRSTSEPVSLTKRRTDGTVSSVILLACTGKQTGFAIMMFYEIWQNEILMQTITDITLPLKQSPNKLLQDFASHWILATIYT